MSAFRLVMPAPLRPALEVRGLCKSFAGRRVLEDVGFALAAGETVCLLGPRGAGKTTLLRCLNWLERPDSGEVRLVGERVGLRPGGHVPMRERELARLRLRMGMAFPDAALWPQLSALGNVMAAPLQVQRRPADEARAEAERLLARVGLAYRKDRLPAELTPGERRRVGLARALALRPDLLLIDAPTAGLDPAEADAVAALLRGLARGGVTMLVATADAGLTRELSGRVLRLERGRLERPDPAADALQAAE